MINKIIKASPIFSDIFGIASAGHHMTTADLATIEEFDRGNMFDDRTVKQVEVSHSDYTKTGFHGSTLQKSCET